MLSGIDHVILASRDPDADAAELERQIGLRAAGGGHHAAQGTFNRLVWLGDSYLELMGVFDRRLAGESWWGRWIVTRLERQPTAYAGVVLVSNDLVADGRRLRQMGSPISEPVDGERVRPDGDVVRWRIARPPVPDPELGLTFLIEHDRAAAEWRPAERGAREVEAHPLGGPARLVRVELPVADTGRAAMRLLRELGLQFRPSLGGAGARDSSIGSQVLRLVRGGQPLIVLRGGAASRSADLLGVRWEIVPG